MKNRYEVIQAEPINVEDLGIPLSGPPELIRRHKREGTGDRLAKLRARKIAWTLEEIEADGRR